MGSTNSPHAEPWCGRSCPHALPHPSAGFRLIHSSLQRHAPVTCDRTVELGIPSHVHVTDNLNVFRFILTPEGSSGSIELNAFNL